MAILGATGPTGVQLVNQALVRGHDVAVLVRNPDRLARSTEAVDVVVGDATNVDDLERVMTGADAVIVALGPGKNRSSDIASRAAAAIIPAATTTGVRRVVIMSALGVGATRAYCGFISRVGIKLVMSKLFADKEAADAMIRDSDLDWTLVYPVTLTNGPQVGHLSATETPTRGGMPRISRADVAAFMLDAAEKKQWIRSSPVLLP